jgi:hypothetical protein
MTGSDRRGPEGEHMDQKTETRWTRAHVMRGLLGGAAVAAGGALIGAREDATTIAAPSRSTDAEILGLLLLLERVQQAFYERALEAEALEGDLLRYTRVVRDQESDHVSFLAARARRDRSGTRVRTDFGDSVGEAARFRRSAIELEEMALAAYIGQGPNLSRRVMADVAPLISVEARQAAWIRDIAGVSPAPHAADPARAPEQVLSDLRKRGYIE